MASGATLDRFTALGAIQPATLGAWLNFRNEHPVLVFDKATQWNVMFESILPRNYGGGGLTLTVYWLPASATTGDVVWSAAIERQDPATNLGVSSYAAVQTATSTAPAASGNPQSCAITFTSGGQMDGLLAGEPYRIYLARVAADGGDTLDEDAHFFKLEVKET